MNLKHLLLASLAAACAAGCNSDIKLEPLPAPPVINKFTASMGIVAKGAKVTLAWDVAEATTVTIAQVGKGDLAGVNDKLFGTVEATVDAESLFVLSAINKRGVKATALATVGVEGGIAKASFAALPGLVQTGGTATLVWNAPGAKTISITPMGGAALDLKGQGDLGSIEVKPAATTQYTLSADGAMKTATVAVAQAITSFTVSKTLGLPGEMVTLTWKTVNASKVIVGSPGKGALVTETDAAKMADGSVMATLPMSPLGTIVPFTLTVEGAGAGLTRTVSVALGNAPKINTFTAPEYVKLGQKFPLTWTTANADQVELATGGVVFWTSSAAAQAASGSLQVDAPAMATDYVLTAKSAVGGGGVTMTVSVKPVGAVTVTTFTATPGTVAAGGTPVVLAWNVPNARRVRIVGSDGHTVATARGPMAETGSASAFPNGAVTYTLDADNTLDAPVTATQMVTVTAPASFGPAASGPVFAGNPVNLDWTVGSNAQIVGYPHSDVVAGTASPGFVDIASTGTKLAFTGSEDDATLTFTPKDFETFLYGARVATAVTVSTNGFFVFAASAATRSTTVAIPNTTIERNFIAPFWANLELGGTGRIFWQVINEAPERTLVVQFDKVKVKGETASELTFEAKVHQTGVVTFEYKKILSAMLPVHVIGIQGVVEGLPISGAADGVSFTFFGPKPAPITAIFNSPATLGGFIKLANGYLKASYTPAPFVTPGAIGITEVMYQPNAAIATTGEWFEVLNNTATPLNLNGWTIDFGGPTHTIASSVVVPANGTILIGQSASGPLNDDVATAYQYGTTFSLAEPAGSVSLKLINYGATATWNQANAGNGGVGVSVGTDANLYLLATDTSTTAPHPISCSSTTAFGTQTPQQLGTPGASGSCFGYAKQSIPVSYFDISSTGTVLSPLDPDDASVNPDEGLAVVDLSSAPFPHFGSPKSTVSVTTNGWIAFKTGITDTFITNPTKPSTTASHAGAVAAFFDDMDADLANANMYARRVAAGIDPANPGAHWIFQWAHWTHWNAGDDLNFQIKLFDTGVIEFHYASMTSGNSSNYANGNSATVWLENPTGSVAMVSSVNQPVVLPNSAIRFTPN